MNRPPLSVAAALSAIMLAAAAPLAKAQSTQPAVPSTPAPASCGANAAATADAVCPRLPGTTLPDVQVRTTDGAATTLASLASGKPAVLVFYRGGWCPFCNVHLGQLQSILPEIEKAGARLIAVSPDRPEKLKESAQRHKLGYTLVSDSPMCAAQAFGVAFHVDDPAVERLRGMKMDIEGDSGLKHHLLPVPAVFVVDADGAIRFSYANPNYKVRLDPQLLLTAVRTPMPQIQLKKP